MKRASIWTIFAFLVILAGPSLVMGGPPTKPVEIVDQPVDVNLVNTEPILVKIDMADVQAGTSVTKEGSCYVDFGGVPCSIFMYKVPDGKTLVATHLFVELFCPPAPDVAYVKCILEDTAIKACSPQWNGAMPAPIAFSDGSEVYLEISYPLDTTAGCTDGCSCNYRVTLMGNLQ